MAKRKDSVALFEVITATKRRQEAAAAAAGQPAPVRSVLRTPKWWFKSRGKQAAPPASEAYAAPQLAAPVETPASEAAPAIVQRVALPPERVTIPERTGDVDPFGLDVPDRVERPRRTWLNIFTPSRGGKKVGLDPDRREVTLRFRYTTAIIIGFAVCVIVGLAYVTGRQTNKASAGPNALSSEAIKRGPVMPGVTDISSDQNAREEIDEPAEPLPPAPKKPDELTRGKPAALTKRVGTNPGMPGPADGVETIMPRVNGLNYVIVQSYPDEKTAIEAQRVLEADGIPCTVEPGPKGWTADPDWRSVVGIHGFPRVYKNTPAYKNYIRAIEATSKKFAGNSKFKQFQPLEYKWK